MNLLIYTFCKLQCMKTEIPTLTLPLLDTWLDNMLEFAKWKIYEAQKEGDVLAEEAWKGCYSAYSNTKSYNDVLVNGRPNAVRPADWAETNTLKSSIVTLP